MSVTLPTASFLGMLQDLLQTVDDDSHIATGGIVLATSQEPTEHGVTTVLAGTSTQHKSRLIGYCRELASGSLPTVLLPGDGAQLIIDAFKKLLKEERKNDLVTYLHVELDGVMIQVTRTDEPGLWSADSTEDQVRTRRGNLEKFPASIWSTLDEVHLDTERTLPSGQVVVAGPRRVLPLDALRRFTAVARRRGGEFEVFSAHPMSPTRVQVGTSYQGLIPAPFEFDGITAEHPDVAVHVPDMPKQKLTPVVAPVG